MFFILGLLSIEKLIKFDCCKGHLNKALIDQNMCMFTVYLELDERIFFKILVQSKSLVQIK